MSDIYTRTPNETNGKLHSSPVLKFYHRWHVIGFPFQCPHSKKFH